VITVRLYKLKWEARKLFAVLLATLGVLAVVYGGSRGVNGLEDIQKRSSSAPEPPKAPLIGDLLTLVASIGYGLYQVLYKRYAALPFDPKLVGEDHYTPASQIEDTGFEEIEGSWIRTGFTDTRISELFSSFRTISELDHLSHWILYMYSLSGSSLSLSILRRRKVQSPYRLTYCALHCRYRSVWCFIQCRIHGTHHITFGRRRLIIALDSIRHLGPITTSVGNLLTIVLVLLSDTIFARRQTSSRFGVF